MSVKTPIRTVFDGDNNATGLSEYQSGEFIGLTHGGLGASLSIGSTGQVLKVSSGGALEFGSVEAIVNIDGATDLTGSTLVAGDQILLSDGGTEGRVTLSQIDTLFTSTTQTLTNKTINTASNTITVVEADISDLQSYILADSTDTLTNKTIDANGTGNSITNLEVADLASGVLDTDLTSVSASDDTLASAKAIKTYVDSQVTASDLDFQGDSGGALSIDLDSETFTVAGGTAISTSGSSNTVTVTLDNTAVTAGDYGSSTAIPTFTVDAQGRLTAAGTASISSNMGIAGDSGTDSITVGTDTFTIAGGNGLTSTATTDTITLDIDSTVVTLTGSQTLTNKTLTSPTITGTGTIAGTFTGNITGDVTGNADTATTLETARTIAGQSFDGSANITIGSTDLSNTSDIVLLTSTQTLTNKTLTSPTITGTGAIAGTFTGNITGDVTGNADTATVLETARTIAGQSFDGSANITIAATDLSDTDQSLSTTDDVTFNDLTVSGDLIVSGTTTTVNTETINLADNTITLNSNEAGTPSENGGIEIERGTSENKTLVWNETSDKWTVGSETFVAGTFEGALTGNVTGNTSGTALTVTQAAQTSITSVGTLTALQVDNLNLNGNTLSSTAGTDLLITPLAGQQIVLDGTIVVDAGVVTGATSITSTNFVGDVTGDVTGNADTATTLATTRAIQVSGAVTGTANFDGSAGINIVTTNTADPTITLGGDLSGAVTLTNLASGTLTATIAANSVALGTDTTGNYVSSLVAGNLIDLQNNTGEGATPTIDVDLSELTTSTSNADGDFFVVLDSVNAQKKLTKGNIAISGFSNDSGFTTNTGDITSVVAGSGLTGGATSGAATLNIGAGTGIDVAADAISVDVSDFMTNGSNNRIVTATGTDAQNAEANLTFDGSTLAVTGAITATGDVTAFYVSDRNLKQNIVNIENSLHKVSQLNGVYYNWTKEALEKHKHLVDEKEVGVIAQDVEAVLPELVATREDGSKAVRYERLCAVLIESVKELKKEIDELKK